MDQALIDGWNDVVGQDDTVYHLGDFGSPTVLPHLEGGTIVLLPGNYDKPEVLEELQKDLRVNVVNGKSLLISPLAEHALPDITLIYEPENADDPETFHLFGHIHQLQMVKRNGLNVGVDCHFFKPIGFDVVKFYYEAITKYYDNNVFMDRLGTF